MSDNIPTKERLARALEERRGTNPDPRAGALIRNARMGRYDDYESELPVPISELVIDLTRIGWQDMAERAKNGEFDGTKEEGEAWMNREGWDLLKDDRKIDWERVRSELADTIEAAREENITLISYNSETGEAWRVSPDGKIEPHEIGPDLTDWKRVNALTEEEIEAMAVADDSAGYTEIEEYLGGQ